MKIYYSVLLLRKLIKFLDKKYMSPMHTGGDYADKKEDIANNLFISDIDTIKRSQIKRGSLPAIIGNEKKRDIKVFIDTVFTEVNDCLPEFTADFFETLDSENIFPEKFEEKRERLKRTEDYMDEEYYSFISELIEIDIANNNKRHTP